MDLLFNGMALGLVLTIMIGPIFVAILQSALERGWRAGASVGIGIWVSDLLFICGCCLSFSHLSKLAEDSRFALYLGIIGGLILAGFGLGILIKKVNQTDLNAVKISAKHFVGFMSKGFAVNTFNPFTFFFWISVTLGLVTKESADLSGAFPFYLGIMLIVVLGDLAKAVLAHWIRTHISLRAMRIVRRVSGAAFILFGVGLIVRVLIDA